MNQSSDTPTFQKKGTVNKCPSCGAQLGAFASACEACGHEFTDVDANRSITSLVARFEEIEQEVDAKGIKGKNREKAIIDKRARVIRDFPVPNSREDLQQLIFFIQPKIVQSVQPDPNIEDWRSKFMEVLNRAKHAYKNDANALAEFDRIEKSLSTTVADTLQIKAKRNPFFFVLAGGAVVLALIGFVNSQMEQRKQQQCEEQYTLSAQTEKSRLEKLTESINQAYQGKRYSEALAMVSKVHWDLQDAACKINDSQQARSEWDVKRNELTELVQKAINTEAAEKSAEADRISAEKMAEANRISEEKQATERKVAEIARIAAEKEKAKALEKKW